MIGAQLHMFTPTRMEPGGRAGGLRWYQEEAVTAGLAQLEAVRATMFVMATGSGKTRTASEFIARRIGETKRCLWLAHRDFLIDQAREALARAIGWQHISVEKAESRGDGSRIVVASVQSLRGDRLKSWKRDWFDLVVIDEGHHAPAASYRAILDHFEAAKVLGITATPARADKIGQHNVFDSVAYRFDIDRAIHEGYFVQPVPIARFIDSIHLETVKTTAGDLNLGALEAEIAKAAAPIARYTFEEMGDRPTIVYTPARSSAHAVAATLNQLRPGSSVSVDMDTPDHERVRILREFGKSIQYICNCAIFTEGLDVPQARGIVVARPTKSESLYIQMVGRGGRPAPGIGELATREKRIAAIAASAKPDFLLLDISGHAGRHSLVNVTDALAGKHVSQGVRDKAREVLARKPGTKLEEAFKLAADELEEEDKSRREAVAKAAAAAEVKARRKAFDPFKRLGVTVGPMETGEEIGWTAEPATAADLKWMAENKIARKDVTHGVVAQLQRQAAVWRRNGRANFKQRNALSKNGLPVDVSFVQASELIEAQVRSGWHRKLDPVTIHRIMNREREPGEDDS